MRRALEGSSVVSLFAMGFELLLRYVTAFPYAIRVYGVDIVMHVWQIFADLSFNRSVVLIAEFRGLCLCRVRISIKILPIHPFRADTYHFFWRGEVTVI